MATLFEVLAARVADWRTRGYPHADYPCLAEILEWAREPDGAGFRLRPPQVRALETYWYVRLVENTPSVPDLYTRLFPKKSDLLNALGIPKAAFESVDFDYDGLMGKIREDDDFVREYRLQALRETLTLAYASYILALAMGAGKTALIGAIIATEFAMASEYRDPDGPFVQNALVFAPGTTIIESLRELAEIPYDRVLPPRFHKRFAASVKLTFTRDGEKSIPVIPRSVFNVVVTNTEKIRIQKETIRKSDLGSMLLDPGKEEEARAEVANLRLQAIASLPHLAVFSDEAHHTYGQALDAELKKVRKTVDYLYHESPKLVCVVNTTGTPYYQKQPLRDVVVWYGLSEGIRDGILKEVAGNIFAYSFDDRNADSFVGEVVGDFFAHCAAVSLPNGAPAKLAIYFPQTADLEELRPAIEAKLATLGQPPAVCLRNTSDSPQAEVDAFNRLNDPASPHRVILLVNKGTEGWNCPSLFACALARRLKTSNNFVLQAASRCLRQVRGNAVKARIYLSMDNRAVLDRQLQDTYGETIEGLNTAQADRRRERIRLTKLRIPPLVVRQHVRTVIRRDQALPIQVRLTKPDVPDTAVLQRTQFDIVRQEAGGGILRQIADTVQIEALPTTLGAYAAAVELAGVYRLCAGALLGELRRVYGPTDEVPAAHLPALAAQIEEQTRGYEVREETVEKALALIKLDGFIRETAPDGTEAYTAEITYPVDREALLARLEEYQDRAGGFGFHYTPYNFDSKPERSFFVDLLEQLRLHAENVEDIYFTGATTDPNKTDFFVEYKGEDGKPHRYTPDFVIRLKTGKCIIVEIKDARFEQATREDIARAGRGEAALTVEGRKAVALKRWEKLNPDRLKYELQFARAEAIAFDATRELREAIAGSGFYGDVVSADHRSPPETPAP